MGIQADLTFAQQIIAGDSWGRISIPIIEAHPWTAIIFFGVLLSVDLGVLNLVLAVIVDTAVQSHEQDLKLQVRCKEAEFRKSAKRLMTICENMDSNKNGSISYDE